MKLLLILTLALSSLTAWGAQPDNPGNSDNANNGNNPQAKVAWIKDGNGEWMGQVYDRPEIFPNPWYNRDDPSTTPDEEMYIRYATVWLDDHIRLAMNMNRSAIALEPYETYFLKGHNFVRFVDGCQAQTGADPTYAGMFDSEFLSPRYDYSGYVTTIDKKIYMVTKMETPITMAVYEVEHAGECVDNGQTNDLWYQLDFVTDFYWVPPVTVELR